jgi:hypothetical protein
MPGANVTSPRSGSGSLRLQFREQIHGVQHLAVGIIELQHADIDHPHREHLRDAVTPGNAPAPIDPDVFLEIIDVGIVHAEIEEVMRDQSPHVRGIHV